MSNKEVEKMSYTVHYFQDLLLRTYSDASDAYEAKPKALVAIYTEYQKDIPDMISVIPESLGMDDKVFYVALQKLENENLIRTILFSVSLKHLGRPQSIIILLITSFFSSVKGITPSMYFT